ncbi:unnamed protein product [Mytilus edulis]|uniref:C2H2-type domain-containing protein n=1 Tax=Mytilus edulis TaxID=6550 RepID=A0A8S3PXF4_MYTED|nr:unnamed protein product [Mytilus edulis]
MYYIRQARLACEIVCESIAPSQGVELLTQVYQSMKLKTAETKQKDAVTDTIISAYKKAEDYTTKVQILSLISHEVLILADWAMKYIPQTFRETQSEWFGKQGISWHLICALVCRPQAEGDENDDDKNFDIYSMVHIVEEQKQGWHIVSQIFSSAFEILKSINPHLKHAYIRSDNAGCYHALPLMGYLWKFRNELSLDVKQYDFSEAQSGKDLCDSRTGTCRLHMLNYINEGNDITNGKQMKKALESHGGIKNMYISVTFGDSKIPETKPASIKSFRYNASFPCFDPNCILEFKKEDQLLKHLSVGKHVVDDEKQAKGFGRPNAKILDLINL